MVVVEKESTRDIVAVQVTGNSVVQVAAVTARVLHSKVVAVINEKAEEAAKN
ncbi:hypothetical protein [Virgibacillus sp. DJP39]|uniref:hypothetical protein n=1 Tax=Virgibacillus sp. DJP39 TaxID=3409790 RepID=UPI003BB52B75